MKVHDLKPADGSRKDRKRVARGIGGKGGKTAGRGTKGQKARNKVPIWFEGGQLPLAQRVPKLRGFNNPFRVEYQAINLDVIEDPRGHREGARRLGVRRDGDHRRRGLVRAAAAALRRAARLPRQRAHQPLTHPRRSGPRSTGVPVFG